MKKYIIRVWNVSPTNDYLYFNSIIEDQYGRRCSWTEDENRATLMSFTEACKVLKVCFEENILFSNDEPEFSIVEKVER